MYPKPLQEEFQKRMDTVGLSLHAQIALESNSIVRRYEHINPADARQGAFQGRFVSAAGVGSTQRRYDSNRAVHESFGQDIVCGGSGAAEDTADEDP